MKNYRQSNVKNLFKKYLNIQLKNNPSEYNSKEVDKILAALEEGHCYGFSSLYMYYQLFGKENAFINKMNAILEWDGKEDTLKSYYKPSQKSKGLVTEAEKLKYGNNKLVANFEHIISQTRLLQAGMFRTLYQGESSDQNFQKTIEHIKRKEQNIKSHLKLGFSYTKQELVWLLQNILKEGAVIFVGVPGHAMAISCKNNKYYFYDPNNLDGEKYCKDISEIIQCITGGMREEDLKTGRMNVRIEVFSNPAAKDINLIYEEPIYYIKKMLKMREKTSIMYEKVKPKDLALFALTNQIDAVKYLMDKVHEEYFSNNVPDKAVRKDVAFRGALLDKAIKRGVNNVAEYLITKENIFPGKKMFKFLCNTGNEKLVDLLLKEQKKLKNLMYRRPFSLKDVFINACEGNQLELAKSALERIKNKKKYGIIGKILGLSRNRSRSLRNILRSICLHGAPNKEILDLLIDEIKKSSSKKKYLSLINKTLKEVIKAGKASVAANIMKKTNIFPEEFFSKACEEGYFEILKSLIEKKKSIKFADVTYNLNAALVNDHKEVVDMLLEIESKEKHQSTYVDYLEVAYYLKAKKTFDLLISKINKMDLKAQNQSKIFKLLKTACEKKDFDIAKNILKKFSLTKEQKESLLQMRIKDISIFRTLIDVDNIDEINKLSEKNIKRLFRQACRNNDIKLMKKIFQNKSLRKHIKVTTEFQDACATLNYEVVKVILENYKLPLKLLKNQIFLTAQAEWRGEKKSFELKGILYKFKKKYYPMVTTLPNEISFPSVLDTSTDEYKRIIKMYFEEGRKIPDKNKYFGFMEGYFNSVLKTKSPSFIPKPDKFLDYLITKGLDQSIDATTFFETAVNLKNLELLKYFEKNLDYSKLNEKQKGTIRKTCFDIALKNKDVDMIKHFLRKENLVKTLPKNFTKNKKVKFKNRWLFGELAIIKLLDKHKLLNTDNKNILLFCALTNGQKDIVGYLNSKYKINTKVIIEEAIKNNRLNLLNFWHQEGFFKKADILKISEKSEEWFQQHFEVRKKPKSKQNVEKLNKLLTRKEGAHAPSTKRKPSIVTSSKKRPPPPPVPSNKGRPAAPFTKKKPSSVPSSKKRSPSPTVPSSKKRRLAPNAKRKRPLVFSRKKSPPPVPFTKKKPSSVPPSKRRPAAPSTKKKPVTSSKKRSPSPTVPSSKKRRLAPHAKRKGALVFSRKKRPPPVPSNKERPHISSLKRKSHTHHPKKGMK